ncbi:hypothetical protein PoB_001823300 [Plakobranchus ocellatus]|uniref:Uncharacterized protein n=1 Tax=Plakobranchus ocellatus TaxID=259542 RepID=A0AAV3ZAE7_9GAST|nr:hypothetical protein PoB_001823300 [Plakobranchus ocellatus]
MEECTCATMPVSSTLRYEVDNTRQTQGDEESRNHQQEQFVYASPVAEFKKKAGLDCVRKNYGRLKNLTVCDPLPMITSADVLFQGMEN